MQYSTILTGSGKCFTIPTPTGMAAHIEQIQFNMPNGSTAQSNVWISGALNGVYRFWNNIEPNLLYGVSEKVILSGNLGANHTIAVGWEYVGDQSMIMTKIARGSDRPSTPWRFR